MKVSEMNETALNKNFQILIQGRGVFKNTRRHGDVMMQ